MRKRVVVGLTLAYLTLAGASLPAQFRGRPEEQEAVKQGWIFSLQRGLAEARATGKPLLVVIRCVP